MNYENTLNDTNFEKSEVSKMEWKSIEKCLSSIRKYNIEKKRIITNIHKCINGNKIF